MSQLEFMTALELRRLIATRAVSPVELTERALTRAEAGQASLNAFCLLMPEEARAAARRAEEAVMRGSPLGLLHGLPVSVKDLIAVAGLPHASGSRAMAGNVATVDAPSVERRGGRLGRGRSHALRPWHRWRRLPAHPGGTDGPRRIQGAVRARPGLADIGNADLGPCRLSRAQCGRCGPADVGGCRPRSARSLCSGGTRARPSGCDWGFRRRPAGRLERDPRLRAAQS